MTPWVPGSNVLEANENFCLVVINFLYVSLELRPYVKELATTLGKILYVQDEDRFNKRPFVKILVVYDLSKTLYDKVSYNIGTETYTLNVNP